MSNENEKHSAPTFRPPCYVPTSERACTTPNQARLTSLFVCLSLIIYYAFSGPVFLDTIGQLAGIHMPNGLVNVSRSIGALLALAVFGTVTPVLPKGDDYMATRPARTDNRASTST